MKYDLILKNIARHVTLDKKEVDYFISLLEVRKLKKKGYLLEPGEVCLYEHFVTRGCLKSFTVDSNGFEHIGTFAVEDWWTGDLHSFLTQTPSTYYVQALEDSELFQISKTNLEQLYSQVPKFERFFRILFQKSLIASLEKNMQNISYPAEDRYLHFINKYPKLEQRISQKQMASYLGITPVFLSMVRKKLSKK